MRPRSCPLPCLNVGLNLHAVLFGEQRPARLAEECTHLFLLGFGQRLWHANSAPEVPGIGKTAGCLKALPLLQSPPNPGTLAPVFFLLKWLMVLPVAWLFGIWAVCWVLNAFYRHKNPAWDRERD